MTGVLDEVVVPLSPLPIRKVKHKNNEPTNQTLQTKNLIVTLLVVFR